MDRSLKHEMTETKDKIELNEVVLKDLLMPLTLNSIIELLKKWGHDIKAVPKSKVKLFKEKVGKTLSGAQFHELWLLREKRTVMRNRNWKLFKFSPEKLKSISIDQLKTKLKSAIIPKIAKKDQFQISIDSLDEGDIYIVADFKGKPRIVEEFNREFKIMHPIQRIRLILDKMGLARINGGSPQTYSKYLDVIARLLETEFVPQQVFSYVLRDFVYKVQPIKKISLVCPREMGGFSGVERITVEGPDVVRGMDDLRSRQEVLFNFDGLSKLGAWTTVESNTVKLDVNGHVQISDENIKKRILEFIQK